MKCRQCGEEVPEGVIRCPKCGKKNNFKGRKKALIYLCLFVFILISLIILMVIGYSSNKNSKPVVDNVLSNTVKAVCFGDYEAVMLSGDSGVFQCKGTSIDHDIVFVETFAETHADMYDIGYDKNDNVEKYFPGANYIYIRDSESVYPDELRMILFANNKENFKDLYYEKLYNTLVELYGNTRVTLLISNTNEASFTTYDKLILAQYNTPKFEDRQEYRMEIQYFPSGRYLDTYYGEYRISPRTSIVIEIQKKFMSEAAINAYTSAVNNEYIQFVFESPSMSYDEFVKLVDESYKN